MDNPAQNANPEPAPLPFLVAAIAANAVATNRLSDCLGASSTFGYTDADAAPAEGSNEQGAWIHQNTTCFGTEALSANQLVVIPAVPVEAPDFFGAPPNLNVLGETATWIVLRASEDGLEVGEAVDDNPVYFVLNEVQLRMLALVGAPLPEFFESTRLSINSDVTIRAGPDALWRTPTRAFLALIQPDISTAETHHIMNAPLNQMTPAQILQRAAAVQLQIQQLQLVQMGQMQQNQIALVQPGNAQHNQEPHPALVSSSTHQRTLHDMAAILHMFDNEGAYQDMFFRPVLRDLGVPAAALGVGAGGLQRNVLPTFTYALDLFDSIMRGEHPSASEQRSMYDLDYFPVISRAVGQSVIRWDFSSDGASIRDFFCSGNDVFTEKLVVALRRIRAFAHLYFGQDMYIVLDVLTESLLALCRSGYRHKLSERFVIQLADRALDMLRRGAAIGPAQHGMTWREWATSPTTHIARLTVSHPDVQTQVINFVSPPQDRSPKRNHSRMDTDRGSKRSADKRNSRGAGAAAAGGGGGGGRGRSASPGPAARVIIPPNPAGAPAVCHAWIRNRPGCSGADCVGYGNPPVKRAHSFDGWPQPEADAYKAAVLKAARSRNP